MEPINYQLDIETSVIIDDVRQHWEKFQRKDLVRLSERFTDILTKKSESVTYDLNSNPLDFNIYLYEIIPAEELRLTKKSESPVPKVFYRYDRKKEKVMIFPDEVPIKLTYGEDDFNLFFAFKLATIDSKKIPDFLEYHLRDVGEHDPIKFDHYLQLILFDYKSILGGRLEIIKDMVADFFSVNFIETSMQTSHLRADNAFAVTANNDNDLSQVFDMDRIADFKRCENELLARGFIDKHYQWNKRTIQCVAFIMVLYDSGFLRKLTKKQQLNARFRKLFKPFFERRYSVKLAKQMQPGYRNSKIVGNHKYQFYFIMR